MIGIEPTTSAWKAEVLPLNYTRIWWVWTESNRRHLELQSNALPTELQTHKWRSRPGSNRRSPAWQAGMLTATPRDHLVAGAGLEPATFGLWARRATTAPPRDNIMFEPVLSTQFVKMEEVEGFEPPRGVTRLSVFKTDPFSQTWVYLQNYKMSFRQGLIYHEINYESINFLI